MTVLDFLLADVPENWLVQDVYYGQRWVLSICRSPDQRQYGGLAAAPQPSESTRFDYGHYPLNEEAQSVLALTRSDDETAIAAGLASLNALLASQNRTLSDADAADWLAEQGRGKKVAVVGRFPFLEEEIRPVVAELWVFERDPQPGEYSAADMPEVLPQADLVAITSSTLINHTIDEILSHISPLSMTILLGPSTPLNRNLLDHDIDGLFGIEVVDLTKAIASVSSGSGFRTIQGLRRVALLRN